MKPTAEQIVEFARRNTEWRAAMMILASPMFLKRSGPDERVWDHVSGDGIDFAAIMAEGTFSSGEQHMVMIAGSLFNGSLAPNLWYAFNILSPCWATLALRAMACLAGVRVTVSDEAPRH